MTEAKLSNQIDLVRLIPTQSDEDKAKELRAEFDKAIVPVLDILTKAKSAGFDIIFQIGVDGFNRNTLLAFGINKKII